MSISCNLYIEFIHIIYLNILIFLILFFFLIVLSFLKYFIFFALFWKEPPDALLYVLSLTSFSVGWPIRLEEAELWLTTAISARSCLSLVVFGTAELSVFSVCFSVVEYKSDASTWPAAERDRWRPALTTLWLGFTLFNGVYIFSFVSGLEEEAAVFCALR